VNVAARESSALGSSPPSRQAAKRSRTSGALPQDDPCKQLPPFRLISYILFNFCLRFCTS
jgi:hypothetical protein